jgi:hypothetical protein
VYNILLHIKITNMEAVETFEVISSLYEDSHYESSLTRTSTIKRIFSILIIFRTKTNVWERKRKQTNATSISRFALSSALVCISHRILLFFTFVNLLYWHFIVLYGMQWLQNDIVRVCYLWSNKIVEFSFSLVTFWSLGNATPRYNIPPVGESGSQYRSGTKDGDCI